MHFIEILELFSNSIRGSLPEKISMMSNLGKSRSNAFIRNDKSYEWLDPDTWNWATLFFFVNAELFSLGRNDITGTLPEDIYFMESLGMSIFKPLAFLEQTDAVVLSALFYQSSWDPANSSLVVSLFSLILLPLSIACAIVANRTVLDR